MALRRGDAPVREITLISALTELGSMRSSVNAREKLWTCLGLGPRAARLVRSQRVPMQTEIEIKAGVIEGFFGRPWDWSARLSELDADMLCILFDDMRGDLDGLPDLQAKVISDVCAWSNAQRFIVCPTYYSY